MTDSSATSPDLQQRNDTGENNNAIAESLPQSNDPLADDGNILQPNAIPTLNIQTVIGIFDTEAQAQQATEALKQAGYGEQQARMVSGDPEQPVNVDADDTKQGSGAMLGGVAGAVAGAAAIGLATFALPVAGTALAIGALSGHAVAAAGGAAVGSVVGATAGGYKGMQVPVDEAQNRADENRADEMQGGFVVALKLPQSDSPDKALAILKQQGARETNVFGPAL